ncbi:Uncharacterised protein [Rhodococcus wratislaviensis]|uniref:Uncharacterized protein n=1 Tax=Rhodococcus wratislaviensis TaxID=44752 RepID=A0AB38FL75_RHOWR|nr:Uncharacterised protein [Rhodococcus wratislaviensis]
MPLVSGSVVVRRADGHVGGLALEDGDRLGERGAAVPALRDPGVAGIGHRAVAEVGPDVHGVRVDPADAGLRLGDVECVVAADEFARLEVEFAHHGRVGATAGEGQQGTRLLGSQHAGPCPHPVLALTFGEGVDVEQDVPLRVVGAVLLEGGAPPDAALVVAVAPEVVQVLTAHAGVGDPVVRVEHVEDPALERGELGVLGVLGERAGVALPHPVE